MSRVRQLIPELSPSALLNIEGESLRGAGLSYRKIEYVKGLAAAVTGNEFDVDGLERMSDEEAIQAITHLRGFGRWSAEIYLMFSLGTYRSISRRRLGVAGSAGTAEKPRPKTHSQTGP